MWPRWPEPIGKPSTTACSRRNCTGTVSYTHLDEYKRQGIISMKSPTMPEMDLTAGTMWATGGGFPTWDLESGRRAWPSEDAGTI